MSSATRYDILEYKYHIPTFVDIDAWTCRHPTITNVTADTICVGCVLSDRSNLFLCMDVIDCGSDVDVHWVHWSRPDGKISHIQQRYDRYTSPAWGVSLYMLDEKQRDDYCPYCNIKLEWAALAERCSKCWWVKGE